MTVVAVVPAPWPRPAAAGAAPWRFARAAEGGGLEWHLQRNVSMSPAQLFGVYASLCVVSLVIALGFTWHGAAPVLAFAGVELLLVGVALLVYARHATDHEHLTLAGGAFTVLHRRGRRTERTEFRAAWVRVEPVTGERSLIEISGDGQTARIGRYLRADLRQPLAQELRAALRVNPIPSDR